MAELRAQGSGLEARGGADYIHGTAPDEQRRLARLNELVNPGFLEFLRVRPGDHVLEVGSGLGILAAQVASRTSAERVVGLEYSLSQLAAVQVSEPNLSFQQGDAHELPFDDDAFDLVYCRFLLEHVGDPPTVLKEMRRVLREGGQVFVMENDITVNRFDPPCPTFDCLWESFIELQLRLGGDGKIGRRLFRLLSDAGFREIELSYQPEIHWSGRPTFAPWVINLLENIEGARDKLVSTGLATESDIAAARDELEDLISRTDSSALFHWDRAKAVK